MHASARIRLVVSLVTCLTFPLSGCGGSSSPSSSVTGTVDGRSFTAVDAISGVDENGNVLVLITDFSPACTAVETLHVGPNQQLLEISLGKSPGAGNYPMPMVGGEYGGFGADCSEKVFPSTSGDLTINAAHDGVFSGTLDYTLASSAGDSGHLVGAFTTTPCAAIGSAAFQMGTFACS